MPRPRQRVSSPVSPTSSNESPRATSSKKRKSTQVSHQRKRTARARPADGLDDDHDADHHEAADSDDPQTTAVRAQLSDDEKKHYIQAFVRYALFNESHRRILRREDIVKNVLADGRGKHFNTLFPKVQKVMRDHLGMELFELRARETASGKSQGRAWIVRSTIPQPLLRYAATHRLPSLAAAFSGDSDDSGDAAGRKTLRAELAAWYAESDALPGDEDNGTMHAAVMRDVKREEGALYGVLGVVLALILVNGKVLADDQLISYLRRLSLFPSSNIPLSLQSPHPHSITLSTLLNTLVREQYLERGKSSAAGAGGAAASGATPAAGSAAAATAATSGRTQAPARTQRTNAQGEKAETGDPAIEWRWGPRAEAEVGEVGVANFVERVFLAQQPGEGDSDEDESEDGGEGGEGPVGRAARRLKAAAKLRREVARAAGVKVLANTEGGREEAPAS